MFLLLGCNPDPGELAEQVGYRDGSDGGATSGERGSVTISEVLWSGSVRDDGVWDPTDVFVELRNESQRPVNLSGWRLEQEGTLVTTVVLPVTDRALEVGAHAIIATRDTGCLPDPDFVVPELRLPLDAPFALTLRDADERLIDGAGDATMPPFAGGYDLRKSRSMEKIELMFGGDGDQPGSWHYYTDAEVDVPNDDRVAEGCRGRTRASPGRPNSPDYSGAFSTGNFE